MQPKNDGEPSKVTRFVDTSLGKYLLALGLFIDEYANLERVAYRALEEASGVTPDMLWVLVGRTPNRAHVIERLKGISKLHHDATTQAAMASAFNQLGLIANLRDRLIHVGALPMDEGTSLVLRPRPGRRFPLENETVIRLEPTILSDVTTDVQTILLRMICHFFRDVDDETRTAVC